LQATEQGIAAAGDAHDAPVRLVAEIRELAAFGEIVALVAEARAQAARVAFLQADDIERRKKLGKGVEVRALAAGQHVRPAAGDVFAVGARAGTGLDVAAQQA